MNPLVLRSEHGKAMTYSSKDRRCMIDIPKSVHRSRWNEPRKSTSLVPMTDSEPSHLLYFFPPIL